MLGGAASSEDLARRDDVPITLHILRYEIQQLRESLQCDMLATMRQALDETPWLPAFVHDPASELSMDAANQQEVIQNTETTSPDRSVARQGDEVEQKTSIKAPIAQCVPQKASHSQSEHAPILAREQESSGARQTRSWRQESFRADFGTKNQSELAANSESSGARQENFKPYYTICGKRVDNKRLDAAIAILLLLNGLSITVYTEYAAYNRTDVDHPAFVVMEICFGICFSFELILKFNRYGREAFTVPGWEWNVFDTLMIVLQWTDIVLTIFFTNDKTMSLMSSVRALKLFRVCRVFRLVDKLPLLTLVCTAIYKTTKQLGATVLVLLALMFMVSLFFTQAVTSYRLTLEEGTEDDLRLNLWFGGVGRSTLTVFEVTFGGVDWDTIVRDALMVHEMLGAVFVVYIGFVTLCMLNVVTGIVVDSGLEFAQLEAGKRFQDSVRDAMRAGDVNMDGKICEEEFRKMLNCPFFADCMKDNDMSSADMMTVFDFLDANKDRTISPDEFLNGILRLPANLRFIDMLSFRTTVQHQQNALLTTIRDEFRSLRGRVCPTGRAAPRAMLPMQVDMLEQPQPPAKEPWESQATGAKARVMKIRKRNGIEPGVFEHEEHSPSPDDYFTADV